MMHHIALRLTRFRLLAALFAWAATALVANAADRVALVIGNSEYEHLDQLPSAKTSARAIADTLGQVGFQVRKEENLDRERMVGVLSEFTALAEQADVALIYYAGHAQIVEFLGASVPFDLLGTNTGKNDIRPINIFNFRRDHPGSGNNLNLIILDVVTDFEAGQEALPSIGLSRRGGDILFFSRPVGIYDYSPFTGSIISYLNRNGLDFWYFYAQVRSDMERIYDARPIYFGRPPRSEVSQGNQHHPAARPPISGSAGPLRPAVRPPSALPPVYVPGLPPVYTARPVDPPLGPGQPIGLPPTERPTLPPHPWPPETPSAFFRLDPDWVPIRPGEKLYSLGQRMTDLLRAAGYHDYSFYSAPNGFALVTRLEAIGADGAPLPNALRFKLPSDPPEKGFLEYIRGLFLEAPPGLYRYVTFIVTDAPYTPEDRPVDEATMVERLSGGARDLTRDYSELAFTEHHRIEALIYEFTNEEGEDASVAVLRPARIPPQTHITKMGIF